jgi:hypothetical protein
MGHLHKIRREIKKNPQAWLNKGATFKGSYHCWGKPKRKGRKGKPTYIYGYGSGKPYHNFVRSVLKELGFIKPVEVKPATQTQLEIFGRIYNIPPRAMSVEEFDKTYSRFIRDGQTPQNT